jgi:dolichol-phosphate mannosyltransferase
MFELTIVIPTLNERDNLDPLLTALDAALDGVAWEAVFVDDDSQDGTADRLRWISRSRSNVRVLQRIGRRGLASACVEGMLASHAPFLAVMDGDLQHDPRLLPKMLDKLRTLPLDMVIGSRHVAGGGVGDFARERQALSRAGARLGRALMRADVRDPMSGFFMLRAEFFHEVVRTLSGTGFKILVDVFLSAKRPVRFLELPYQFGNRHAGNSKLDMMISLEYLQLLADKSVGRFVPLRFVLFVTVGTLGVLVHLGVLGVLHDLANAPFALAQVVATLSAMTGNFFANNAFTYRDRRLHGSALWWGLGAFCLACSIGAVMNNVIADLLFVRGAPWAVAGLAGAFVGSVWNYATTATLVWQTARRSAKADATVEPGMPSARAEPALQGVAPRVDRRHD